MPGTITANPNPVGVPKPQTSGTTTISWTITNQPGGVQITQSVNGGPDQRFFPPTGTTNANGQQPATVSIGSTYLFKLKDFRGAVLASVTVIARQPQPVFPDAAKHMGTGVNISANLGYIQLIRNLRVVPGFYNADFKFTLSQPTNPWNTIAIAPPGPGPAFDPADVVRPPTPLSDIFSESKNQYHLNVMPLTPNTLYYYIITAASSTPNDPPATKTGNFTTTLRTAMVYFDSVRVWRDGDPNANGELKFTFGVFDGVTRQYLGPSRGTKNHPIPPMQYPAEGWADLGDGDFVELHRGPVIIDNGPTTLTLWVNCEDYDGPVDPTTWGTLGGPGSFPEEFAPGKGSGDYDAGEWAAAQERTSISPLDFMVDLHHEIRYDISSRRRVVHHFRQDRDI